MKHQHHATRNSMIIFGAIALIIVGGIYFWRKDKGFHCSKICTTVDEEKSCTDICVKR